MRNIRFLLIGNIFFKTFKTITQSNCIGMIASLNNSKDQKLQKRTFYGFKRENEYNYVKSRALPMIKYKISPVGIGKISSLRSKLEKIVGSIFEGDKSKEINPCFDYILKKLIYYQAINSQKKTDYKNIVLGEMTVDLNNPIHEGAIKDKVYHTINSIQEEQNQQSLGQRLGKGSNRMQRLDHYYRKVEKIKQELIVALNNKFNEKRKLYQTQRALSKQQLFFFSDKYIDEIVRNIDAIQPLRISQQSIKYEIFSKKNKNYFDVELIRQRQLTKPYNHIKINRPSNEIDSLIQNIFDMVRQREQGINYKPQSNALFRDIFEQLKRYQQLSQGGKYEFLSPATVIFDQISLTPKLSFEPLLLNTFGISHKPYSLQTRLTFAPTPKQFDYFISQPQLKTKYQRMLSDPFYGNIDLYDTERHRINSQRLNEIEDQRIQLLKLKQKVVVWRFMLLSYYLLHSVQFGFVASLTSNSKKRQKLEQKILRRHKEVEADMSKLSQFFELQNGFFQSKPFNFTLQEIGDYLSIENEDSVVENTKYVIVKKYFQCRNIIIKQFIRLLVNDTIFGRILNIKKYIFLFLAIAIEVIEESQRYIKAQKLQQRERKKLRLYLQKELKRMKNDKNHYSYLQITYEKIEVYQQRDPSKDHQAKFAKQEEIGKIMMKYVEQAKKFAKEIQQLNEELNKLEGKDNLSIEEKNQFTNIMKRIQSKSDKYSQELRAIIIQFIFSELRLKNRDGPHRYSSDSTKFFKQSCAIYTNRLELLTLTFTSMSQGNFIKYDSLVMPQFKIEEADKMIQIYNSPQALNNEENLLKIVSEVIEPAKLLPKKMDKLSSKGINDEFKIYQEKYKQSGHYYLQKDNSTSRQSALGQKIVTYTKKRNIQKY